MNHHLQNLKLIVRAHIASHELQQAQPDHLLESPPDLLALFG